jgi:hypothetical protein
MYTHKQSNDGIEVVSAGCTSDRTGFFDLSLGLQASY